MKNKPCETCGHNRWKTVKKGLVWMCRNCGVGRVASDEQNKEVEVK